MSSTLNKNFCTYAQTTWILVTAVKVIRVEEGMEERLLPTTMTSPTPNSLTAVALAAAMVAVLAAAMVVALAEVTEALPQVATEVVRAAAMVDPEDPVESGILRLTTLGLTGPMESVA